MNRQGLSKFSWANEDRQNINQIKITHPAEVAFIEQRPYRPIKISLEELQCIALALKKGAKI